MRALCALFAGVLLVAGCAVQKTVTITTTPPDALVRVNNIDRGSGPVIEKFSFQQPTDVFYVTAMRKGFQDQTVPVGIDVGPTLAVQLKPYVKRITINCLPVPGIICVDGRPLTPEPVSTVNADVEFTVDKNDAWVTHAVTAERTGFIKAEATVQWADNTTLYNLKLDAMRKDLRITSTPTGATVTLDDKELGVTPLLDKQRSFEFDTAGNQWVDRVLRVAKPGYDPVEQHLSWDNGRSDYNIDLIAKHKQARLITDPAGSIVTIDGATVKQDASGVSTADLDFPPINERGTLRTYKVHVSKKTADAEWYPLDLTLAWDDGKTDYPIKLREILSQPMPVTTLSMVRQGGEWGLHADVGTVIGMKFDTEPDGEQPQKVIGLPKGQTIGSVSVSPDGQYLVYSVIGKDENGPTSQMFRVRTDGSGGSTALSDGRSVDVTPAFTAAGDKIVFSSNRAGKKFSVWAISAAGEGGVTRYTSGDTNDLWPGIDASAKPRLFYQAHIDTRSDPRLYVVQVGTSLQTDLTTLGGMEPKISPRNGAVAYTLANEKTGKHDLYKVTDRGGAAESLTTDADNINPAWNASGTQIAFASDRGKEAEEKRQNYDIWVMDLTNPSQLKQITRNGSVDDLPVFDPAGDSIYFRSNRGGVWGVWKIAVK